MMQKLPKRTRVNSKLHTTVLISGLALVGGSSLALAVECVKPGGADGCFDTIQGAVDAADPGERIKVFRGTYFENVTIPPGKKNIKIIGKGKLSKIIVDPDFPNAGPAFTVQAPGVQIKRITIENGEDDAILIEGTAKRTKVIKVKITSPDGDCIDVGADDVMVKRSTLLGCGDDSIDVDADGVMILDNSLKIADNNCIDVSGDGAEIKDNTISLCEDGSAVELEGDDFVVQDNTALDNDDEAFIVDCTPCTAGGLVEGNVTNGTPGDACGFDLSADAAGLVVRNNLATRSNDCGFYVNGDFIELYDNKARLNGGDSGDGIGFDINGTGNTLSNNLAEFGEGDGFQIWGSDHVLDGNQANENFEDGFDVVGDNVVVVNNEAWNNLGVGIEVSSSADGTEVDGNTARRNRTDFCDEGTNTIVGTNNFKTTGGCVIGD